MNGGVVFLYSKLSINRLSGENETAVVYRLSGKDQTARTGTDYTKYVIRKQQKCK